MISAYIAEETNEATVHVDDTIVDNHHANVIRVEPAKQNACRLEVIDHGNGELTLNVGRSTSTELPYANKYGGLERALDAIRDVAEAAIDGSIVERIRTKRNRVMCIDTELTLRSGKTLRVKRTTLRGLFPFGGNLEEIAYEKY